MNYEIFSCISYIKSCPRYYWKKKKWKTFSTFHIWKCPHEIQNSLYFTFEIWQHIIYMRINILSISHTKNLCWHFPTRRTEIYVHHIWKTVPTWNLGFCIFQIWKYVQWYYYIKYGIVYISHLNTSLWLFYSFNYQTLYILHMKILMLILVHDTLNFFGISFYKNLDVIFLTQNVEFSIYHIWKSGWSFS